MGRSADHRRRRLPQGKRVNKVRDSKALTEAEREALFDRIGDWCVAWSVGHASEECDELGMSEAQRLAARRALDDLGVVPSRVLIDGKWDFVGGGITRRIVKGDATCLSISAASILAKVSRDRIMRAEADHYPGYDFDTNKGYPCRGTSRRCGAWGRRDPPPQLGVHGPPAVERRRALRPAAAAPRPAGILLRLSPTGSGRGC